MCKICILPIDHLNRAGFAKRGKSGYSATCSILSLHPFFDAYIVPHLRGIEPSSKAGPSPLTPRAPRSGAEPYSPFDLEQSREIISSPSFAHRTLPQRAPVARDP
jgi:hypothetical protein